MMLRPKRKKRSIKLRSGSLERETKLSIFSQTHQVKKNKIK